MWTVKWQMKVLVLVPVQPVQPVLVRVQAQALQAATEALALRRLTEWN